MNPKEGCVLFPEHNYLWSNTCACPPQHFEPFHKFNFQEVDRENFQKVWVPEYDNSIGKLT